MFENQPNPDNLSDPIMMKVGWTATDKAPILQKNLLTAVNNFPKMNWSYHVMMNHKALTPKPESNIPGLTLQWSSPMWKKTSPQISMNKGSATNTIDGILLKSIINSYLVKNYFEQVKKYRCDFR